MNKYLEAANRLYTHILKQHWTGQTITGPDPIGKINWRITRFVKSYTRWLPWPGDLTYLQAQSYWILDNLRLCHLMNDENYLNKVEKTANYILKKQLPNGAWEHPPLRERKGFISTVETVWAALGLVAAYKELKQSEYLEAITKSYEGLVNVIGIRPFKDEGLAINYHAHTSSLVPNVTTMFIWLAAEIYHLTGDKQYLQYNEKMVRFLECSQMENGELQYIYELRPNFQSFQYNSYQFLDLAHYFELTQDERVWEMLGKIAKFLSTGVTAKGSSRYDNFKTTPEVNYWNGVLAMALRKAHEMDLGNYLDLSERGYNYLLTRQRADGGFGYSKYNYKFLQDNNSYPRYLAMILNQLLYRAHFER